MTRGDTASCGCLRTEKTIARQTTHGLHRGGKHPLYDTWRLMKRRCENQNDPAYPHYGARGIAIAPEWQSFARFVADMGACPAGLTLERKDNDGPYSPSNCQWASRTAQANNRRSGRYIEHSGLRLTVAEWAKRTGIKSTTIRQRIDSYGWDTSRALSP